MSDRYQERYVAHQARKKQVLIEIMLERHSNRRFSDDSVSADLIQEIIDTKDLCPSSCDRQGIMVRTILDRDEKALLSGLLVGGTGFIHRAPVILLLFADKEAYKAGDEIKWMGYLDAGIVVQQYYLTATALSLHCCFINPNIREMNKPHFEKIFGDQLFCGAFALGYPYGHSVPIQKT